MAKMVAMVFDKLPFLAGIDLDWESPQSKQEWRDLGRLAKDVRSASSRKLVITTTYHPRSGAIEVFGNLKSKSGASFLDFFDYCHSMAYTHFDPERRHSTQHMDRGAIEEWIHHRLPLSKLTLGVPFFGVKRKTGEAKSYASIIDDEPSLKDRVGTDESKDGTYFVNARSMAQKVAVAKNRGLAGVMIWEVGQDKPLNSGASLMRHIVASAREGQLPDRSWREWVLSHLHGFGEDQAICVMATIIGAFLLVKVLTVERPRDRLQPPPRPMRSMAEANGHAETLVAEGSQDDHAAKKSVDSEDAGVEVTQGAGEDAVAD